MLDAIAAIATIAAFVLVCFVPAIILRCVCPDGVREFMDRLTQTSTEEDNE